MWTSVCLFGADAWSDIDGELRRLQSNVGADEVMAIATPLPAPQDCDQYNVPAPTDGGVIDSDDGTGAYG